MNKELLREKYKLIRKSITEKNIKDNIIYNKVINDDIVKRCSTILIYVSFKDEVDTLKLIKFFLQNKRVAVPKIENNNMNFYYIKSLEELKSGYFGILEPVSNVLVTDFSNCVCITPGICFDLNGNRIGYGKGFYDKFFNEVDIYKIGLCYKKCLVRKIDVNKFDKTVEKVITD